MYLLQGNENGTYGYVREMMIKEDGTPYMHDIIDLVVDQNTDWEAHSEINFHSHEDDFLSDTALDDVLITRRFSNGEWEAISSKEYLQLKRELIPIDNDFVDLRDTEVCYLAPDDEIMDVMDGTQEKIYIAPDEIETLFSKWLVYIEQMNQ